MAFFGVTVEVIETCAEHPNADRLEICSLQGLSFRFVTKRGAFQPGDRVLYFPLDALIPEVLQDRLGVKGYLAGGTALPDGKKLADRVKTVRLRGEFSQGIVGQLSILDDLGYDDVVGHDSAAITAFLGVKKYEPSPIMGGAGVHLVDLPAGLSVYDIEGADRYAAVTQRLLSQRVHITEKLEGSNFSVFVNREGEVAVNQRGYSIQLDDGVSHVFWKVAEEQGILGLAHQILVASPDAPFVGIYGEMLGNKIQGNYYRLDGNEVRIFDVRLGVDWAAPDRFHESIPRDKCVPVLANDVVLADWLDGKSVQEASDGRSVLVDRPREGIVIRPMQPAFDEDLGGRLILKQRSPRYLAKTDF